MHFEEVDVAGVVFFARFFGYAHDAMERFFDDLEGGYVALVNKRSIGFPAVHASADYKSPIRYGDVVRITGDVTRLGTTAAHFSFVMTRVRDAVHVATMMHVHVCTDIRAMAKLAFPPDVRAALERHLVPSPPASAPLADA